MKYSRTDADGNGLPYTVEETLSMLRPLGDSMADGWAALIFSEGGDLGAGTLNGYGQYGMEIFEATLGDSSIIDVYHNPYEGLFQVHKPWKP